MIKYPEFHQKISQLKDGAYDVSFYNRRYLLRKETRLSGKLIKLYAHELGGRNFVSLNYYPNLKNGLLKPCEMPPEKVMDFVLKLTVLS